MLEVLSSRVVGPVGRGLVGVSGGELRRRYVEARRREAAAAGEAAVVLGEIDRRRSYARCGFLSPVAFVAHETGDSPQAAGRVRVARALGGMPAAAEAYRAGEIDTVRVRRLVDAHDTAPGRYAADEAALVDRACTQDAASFTATVALWRERAAADVVRDDETIRFRRRRLTMTDTLFGMTRLEADLDPVSAETITVAIQSLAGPVNRDHHDGSDGRTPTQRRVDALVEICRRHLDGGPVPSSGGRRPHLDVIIDLDTLTGPRSHTVATNRHLGPAARQFLACDATVCGAIMDGPHRLLDMGRRARTATAAQRHALLIRDGGCIIAGCDQWGDWCDAHHLTPWTHGGTTNLDNLVLLCRPHHLMHHYGTLQLPQRE